MLINVKMPTIVGTLTFMSMLNFVLSLVEHKKSLITLEYAASKQFLCNIKPFSLIRETLFKKLYFALNWAVACDFQQCGILTSVDSDEPMQPPFKLRNSKWCSVSSLTILEYSSAGWSEALLVAHTTLLEISCTGSTISGAGFKDNTDLNKLRKPSGLLV